MHTFRKVNFAGGLNQQFDPTKISPNSEYFLGINVRVRDNNCASIRGPRDLADEIPAGNYQGLYTFDDKLLLFISGIPYYKTANSTIWHRIDGVALSSEVDEIDVETIPESSLNFMRRATENSTQSDNAVEYFDPLGASPECLIAMDGVSQPILIFINGTSRATQNYSQWTKEFPEYVPIARHPLWFNGKLYCVGRSNNGRFTRIYHSVSGKPLDFVILLDRQGNKISPNEDEGGAPQLAHRVSFGQATAVKDATALGFLYTTSRGSWLVTPDTERLIAAEPTFINQTLFGVGAVNKNSIANVLGDTAIVYYAGIRTFNGIEQFRNRGAYTPFNAKINNILGSRQQSNPATVEFDNYTAFSVSTVYGDGILWYDNIFQTFVSLDIYPGVGSIKQFAVVSAPGIEQLYFITRDNKLYQAFAGAPLKASLFLHEFVSADNPGGITIRQVSAVFSKVKTAGTAQASVYSDRQPFLVNAQSLRADDLSAQEPSQVPYNFALAQNTNPPLVFQFDPTAQSGYRAGVGITWDAEAALVDVSVEFEVMSNLHAIPTKTAEVANVTAIFVGEDGVTNADRTAVSRAIKRETFDLAVGLGNHAMPNGTALNVLNEVHAQWGYLHLAGKFKAVPGTFDRNTNNAEPLFNYLRQQPARYAVHALGPYVDLFFINDGLNSSGVQVDPDNVGPVLKDTIQFKWLRAALAASTKRWKLVCWNTPALSSVPGAAQILSIPLREWGATALLCGGARLYERLVEPDGMLYFTVGTGGAALASVPATLRVESRQILSQFGYLKLTASPLTLRFEFKDTDGISQDLHII